LDCEPNSNEYRKKDEIDDENKSNNDDESDAGDDIYV
jgi:hypothetical protein